MQDKTGVKAKPVIFHRRAYQVCAEGEWQSTPIGFKGRLVSWRRAMRIASFLRERGREVRVRFFGNITMPMRPRVFD
jgi:hypothetical protein